MSYTNEEDIGYICGKQDAIWRLGFVGAVVVTGVGARLVAERVVRAVPELGMHGRENLLRCRRRKWEGKPILIAVVDHDTGFVFILRSGGNFC